MVSFPGTHSLICAFCLPSVGEDLIFNIDHLYTLGCSAPFSYMIQSEFHAHWFTTIAGSHVAFCLCFTQTGVPGNNSWYFFSGLQLFPCLLMSSWWVWCISWAPSALGNWGKFFFPWSVLCHQLQCDAMLADRGCGPVVKQT